MQIVVIRKLFFSFFSILLPSASNRGACSSAGYYAATRVFLIESFCRGGAISVVALLKIEQYWVERGLSRCHPCDEAGCGNLQGLQGSGAGQPADQGDGTTATGREFVIYGFRLGICCTYYLGGPSLRLSDSRRKLQ